MNDVHILMEEVPAKDSGSYSCQLGTFDDEIKRNKYLVVTVTEEAFSDSDCLDGDAERTRECVKWFAASVSLSEWQRKDWGTKTLDRTVVKSWLASGKQQ